MFYYEIPRFLTIILSNVGLINENQPTEPQVLSIVCYVVFLVGVIVFSILMFTPAAYGKFSVENSWFGFGVNARTAWFLQESPSFFIPAVLCVLDYKRREGFELPRVLLIGLFMLHYWQRTFIYSFLIRGGKPTPVGICALAFTFCTVNGYIQARCIQVTHYPDNWLNQLTVWIGILLYSSGFAINLHSDYILRNLRKPGETGYKIPRGGFFNYVTAANYFGETIEWLGFFLAAQTLASAAFSFFTLANLLPRAISHHRWYKSKFDDYPKERKIFFPLLF